MPPLSAAGPIKRVHPLEQVDYGEPVGAPGFARPTLGALRDRRWEVAIVVRELGEVVLGFLERLNAA